MNQIYNLNEGIDTIEAKIKQDFSKEIYRDTELRILAELVDNLENGLTKVSYAFIQGGILIPNVTDENTLPLMLVNSETYKDIKIIGQVQIPKIYVSTVKDFSKEYFKLDDYPTKKEALKDLSESYSHKFKPTDIISMYWIENFERI